MLDIKIHSILSRHTLESEFTHWTLSDDNLLERVRESWHLAQTGYRDGVVVVPVHPSGFFSPVVFLQPGDQFVGSYKSRQPGETPRKSTAVLRPNAAKSAAVGVNVICYHRDVLAEDNEQFDAEWAIVSVNARITHENEPMTVGTLLANHFKADGGTDTKMTPAQFETALRTSYNYWKDKGKLAVSHTKENTDA